MIVPTIIMAAATVAAPRAAGQRSILPKASQASRVGFLSSSFGSKPSGASRPCAAPSPAWDQPFHQNTRGGLLTHPRGTNVIRINDRPSTLSKL